MSKTDSSENKSQKTGYTGESNARLCLSRVAFVNKYECDFGLDFFCELTQDKSQNFFVQAKSSRSPKRDENFIYSLPVRMETVKDYWLKKTYPVFVVMSDLSEMGQVYYLLVNHETLGNPLYEKSEKSIRFRIPLANKLSSFDETNPEFIQEVMTNQASQLSFEVTDLEEVNLLKIMRGSDQSKQIKVREIIKNNLKKYKAKSAFKKALRDILIGCKDRVTQHHVLETLILLDDKKIIKEIPEQIERNTKLFDYRSAEETRKYTFTSFLFDGLVKLKAKPDIYEEIRSFLDSGEMNLIRDVIRTVGGLKIEKGVDMVLSFFQSDRMEIRWEAYEALAKISGSKLNGKLYKLIKNSSYGNEVSSAIYCCSIKNLKSTALIEAILDNIGNKSPKVRKSICKYLGEVKVKNRIELLKLLLFDESHEVRREARRSLLGIDEKDIGDIEANVLTRYTDMDGLLYKADLIGTLNEFATRKSISFLKKVIVNEQKTKSAQYTGLDGYSRNATINLGANAMVVLIKLIGDGATPLLLTSLEESTDEYFQVRVVMALGNLRDKRALETLEKIEKKSDGRLANWAGQSIKRINQS